MKEPCVYILASKHNGTLYVGVTSDLHERMAQHEQGLIDGFTKTHGINRLVYYEMHDDMGDSHPAREAAQGLEAHVEAAPHRADESRVARSL